MERPPRVFVSYARSDDPYYRDLLKAWGATEQVELSFPHDDVGSPTMGAEWSKAQIARGLEEAQVLLVLVGARTKDDEWVNWEIDQAKAIGLRLAAVKLSPSNSSPPGLIGAGTAWANSFKRSRIMDALRSAVSNG